MMLKKLLHIGILVCTVIVMVCAGIANASTFSVSISGVDALPFPVTAFTIDFKVPPDDFSPIEVVFGDAPLATGGFTWNIDKADYIKDNIYEVGGADWGALMDNPTGLRDGVLFSLNYEGTINCSSFDFIKFTGYDYNNDNPVELYPTYIKLASINCDGAQFAAVPIPATAILFLSGIFGLVGIRRFKGGQGES